MPAQMMSLQAAADYLGTGAIEVNDYEPVIADIVRRRSVALQRFKEIPATGQPHRYFEQTAIAQAAFASTGGQGGAALSPTPASPTRVERSAFVKAVVNQSNIALFDKLVTQQQKKFAGVIAQDIEDIISGINTTRAAAVWNGTDTSLSAPTTTQYMGLLSQITTQATVASGTSIIDGIKGIIATLVGNANYVVKPSAVYVNPILGDYIDREAKAEQITMNEEEVVAGVKVKSFSTQAGILPIVGDAFLPAATGAAYGFSAPPAGLKNYFAVVLMEEFIEMPYVSGENDDPKPMLFQLGLTGNLTGQFVGVKFDTIVAKGATYAHAVVCVQRP
ncbi:MAG: SU10 major capsid protein [Burkholderiales bacterium]